MVISVIIRSDYPRKMIDCQKVGYDIYWEAGMEQLLERSTPTNVVRGAT